MTNHTTPTKLDPKGPATAKQEKFLSDLRRTRSHDEQMVADLIERANGTPNLKQTAILIDYLVSCEIRSHHVRVAFEEATA